LEVDREITALLLATTASPIFTTHLSSVNASNGLLLAHNKWRIQQKFYATFSNMLSTIKILSTLSLTPCTLILEDYMGHPDRLDRPVEGVVLIIHYGEQMK
jgi:hypothetical protein